jgi:hypothetical protein
VKCERCGTIFCWDGADAATLSGMRKRFCSDECKRNGRSKGDLVAQRERRRQRWHQQVRQLRDCQLRTKNPYESREEAIADAARVLDESGVALHPYPCACGWWHLTSRLQEETPRV